MGVKGGMKMAKMEITKKGGKKEDMKADKKETVENERKGRG